MQHEVVLGLTGLPRVILAPTVLGRGLEPKAAPEKAGELRSRGGLSRETPAHCAWAWVMPGPEGAGTEIVAGEGAQERAGLQEAERVRKKMEPRAGVSDKGAFIGLCRLEGWERPGWPAAGSGFAVVSLAQAATSPHFLPRTEGATGDDTVTSGLRQLGVRTGRGGRSEPCRSTVCGLAGLGAVLNGSLWPGWAGRCLGWSQPGTEQPAAQQTNPVPSCPSIAPGPLATNTQGPGISLKASGQARAP